MADIDFTKVKVRPLNANTLGRDMFKNKMQSMVKHLQKDALIDQERRMGTTWVWNYDGRTVLGFISLATHTHMIDRKDIKKDYINDEFPYATIQAY